MEEYLKWNDWCVLGEINNGNGGKHGKLISERRHYRKVYETPEATSWSILLASGWSITDLPETPGRS